MAYKQQKFISHGSGVWESKIKALADQMSGKCWLSYSSMAVFTVLLGGERDKGGLRVLLYKGTDLTHEDYVLMT